MKPRSIALFFLIVITCLPVMAQGIGDVMDHLVARLKAQFEPNQLNGLDTETILRFVTPEERATLATGYWTFLVRVPVTVSLMRDVDQKEVPFWIEEAGFTKTDLTVASEYYTYEVWQKDFPAGPIGLGINGFDEHRPHYFVAVGAQNPGDVVNIENLYPSQFDVRTMEKGALTYHDWTELVLEQVPEALTGQKLLTTIRGRSREAHIRGAFRETAYPTSAKPDLVALTWAGDPRTTQAVQWRTSTMVSASAVHYYEAGAPDDEHAVRAQPTRIVDRMLRNDPVMHRWTAKIDGLKPGTAYAYYITTGDAPDPYEPGTFTTAPEGDADFGFIYLGDTHRNPAWGEMMTQLRETRPEAAFYTLAGDLVGTGLHRDDWDAFFALSTDTFSERPVMPCIGNHDDHDGLGARMYLDMFALPENGPEGVRSEGAYSFTYGDALFLILDIGSDEHVQAAWMENVLKNSDAQWKFAMFHFPPYDPEEDYPTLRSLWGGLFESYGVDIVMTGHVHHYLRTKPIHDGKFMESAAEGTTYVTSIAIPYETEPFEIDYAAATEFAGGPIYQYIEIKGDTLHYTAAHGDGKVVDEFVIDKSGN